MSMPLVTAPETSRQPTGIPQEMLAKVLQRLARAGLLVSHYGLRGGYALARDANEIPVLPVLEVIRASGPKRESSHREYSNHLRFVYDTIEALLRRLTVGALQRSCSVVPQSHFSSDLLVNRDVLVSGAHGVD
jgi:DNA-binding IscR family transcriptional regulator